MSRRVSRSKRAAVKRLKKYDPRKDYAPVSPVHVRFVDPTQLWAEVEAARRRRLEQKARAVRRVQSLPSGNASADR